MRTRIADLLIEIPEVGGMAPRLAGYQTTENGSADILISAEYYRWDKYPRATPEEIAYWESGLQFSHHLLSFEGLVLHASAVELGGRAYLFSGPSGVGKSTHTRLWREVFPAARLLNDDKPALRLRDGRFTVYGTPWSGKGENRNASALLAGICFLSRGERNEIRRLNHKEATVALLSQTMRVFGTAVRLDKMLSLVAHLVEGTPVFELSCTPTAEAARVSYAAMCPATEDL